MREIQKGKVIRGLTNVTVLHKQWTHAKIVEDKGVRRLISDRETTLRHATPDVMQPQ